MASAKRDPIVCTNDKLLKALITLLAFKDEHLLNELRIVFAAASITDSPIASGGAETWTQVRHELDLIGDLVDEMEKSEAARASTAEMH